MFGEYFTEIHTKKYCTNSCSGGFVNGVIFNFSGSIRWDNVGLVCSMAFSNPGSGFTIYGCVKTPTPASGTCSEVDFQDFPETHWTKHDRWMPPETF